MSKDEEEYSGYFGIKNGPEGFQQFTLKSSRERVQEWAEATTEAEDKDKPVDEVEQKPDEGKEESLESLMERFSDTIMSYYSLIDTTYTIPSVLLYAHVQMEVVKPLADHAVCISDDGNLKIYGLNASQHAQLAKAGLKINRIKNGTEALPSSTLLSLVAAFDSMISDLVAFMLKGRKEKLNISDKSVPISEILAANSIDDLVERFVADQVYELLRGSHDEQVGFLERTFDIDVRTGWLSWSDFIEIFERRNLLAHGETFYTRRYLNICQKHGQAKNLGAEGERIELDKKYLQGAADILLEFFILITFSLWRKHFKESSNLAFDALNHSGFKLIVEERFSAADNILAYGLSLKNTNCSEVTRRMMTINRANALKKMGDKRTAAKVLSSLEWNAAADKFQICEAAVRDDIEAVVAKLDIVHKTEAISASDIREWPVFDGVREDKSFQAEFEKVFQEPLMAGQRGEVGAEPHDDSEEPKPSAMVPKSGAVH